ncbi:hypothetical protein [Nonomuraea recticatena]
MGANHAHGPAIPASRRTVWLTLAVIIPLALGTVIGLIALWPSDKPGAGAAPGLERLTGTITSITLKPCPELPPKRASPRAPSSRLRIRPPAATPRSG